MKTITLLAIFAIVAAIGIVTSTISNNIVFADKGGIPNANSQKHCAEHQTSKCLPPCYNAFQGLC